MLNNWFLINPLAPGQAGGATELISQAWKIGGEIMFGIWIFLTAFFILAAIWRPGMQWLKAKISTKEGESKTLKAVAGEMVLYIVVCVIIAILIAVIPPIFFNIETSGGGISGGPYFSGIKTFF